MFDKNWYLAQYPEVKESDGDPILHYYHEGEKKNYQPSAYFSPKFYLDKNPDVKQANMSPLVHYIRHGETEGRLPSVYFSQHFYLEKNPDVERAGMSPLRHYIVHGKKEGRQPREKKSYQNIYYFDRDIRHFFKNTFEEKGFIPITAEKMHRVSVQDLVIFMHPNWDGIRDNQWVDHCKTHRIDSLAIIHDLIYAYGVKIEEEVQILNNFTYILGQSEKMNVFLRNSGVTACLANLEFFDYPLIDKTMLKRHIHVARERGRVQNKKNTIAYAGKVWHPLRHWIFSDALKNIPVNIYYPMTEEEQKRFAKQNKFGNLTYHGGFSDEELFSKLEGDYGLIWNGTDEGQGMFDWKKISLSSKFDYCIARVLPIICKKGTLDGELVEKYNIGFTISHLSMLEAALNETTYEQYQQYLENLVPLAQQVCDGYFLKRALSSMINR